MEKVEVGALFAQMNWIVSIEFSQAWGKRLSQWYEWFLYFWKSSSKGDWFSIYTTCTCTTCIIHYSLIDSFSQSVIDYSLLLHSAALPYLLLWQYKYKFANALPLCIAIAITSFHYLSRFCFFIFIWINTIFIWWFPTLYCTLDSYSISIYIFNLYEHATPTTTKQRRAAISRLANC